VLAEPAPQRPDEDLLPGRDRLLLPLRVLRADDAQVLFRTSASPIRRALVAVAYGPTRPDRGVADSDCSVTTPSPTTSRPCSGPTWVEWAAGERPTAAQRRGRALDHPGGRLKAAVEELRPLQAKDGSVTSRPGRPRYWSAGSPGRRELAPFSRTTPAIWPPSSRLRRWSQTGSACPISWTRSPLPAAGARQDGWSTVPHVTKRQPEPQF